MINYHQIPLPNASGLIINATLVLSCGAFNHIIRMNSKETSKKYGY